MFPISIMPFKFNLGRGIIERVSNTERERVSVSENRERDPRIKERYRAFGDIEHTERGTEREGQRERERERKTEEKVTHTYIFHTLVGSVVSNSSACSLQ